MENKNQNEELQSRREFFKKAAKGVLPILGAAVLAGAPAIVNAAEKTPMGCESNCYGTCKNTCRGTCEGNCKTTCYDGCYGRCWRTCLNECSGGCKKSCNGR